MAHSPFAEDAATAAGLSIPLMDAEETAFTQTHDASIDDTQGNDDVGCSFIDLPAVLVSMRFGHYNFGISLLP